MMKVSKEGVEVKQIANCDVFVGNAIHTAWGRLFGGQALGQSLFAASRTVPDEFPIHSLHAYFVLGGDDDKEILYEVDRVRDGRSFMTRSCKAMQDKKSIFLSQMSYQRIEKGLNFQVSLDELLLPMVIPDVSKMSDEELSRDFVQDEFFKGAIRHSILKSPTWNLTTLKIDPNVKLSDPSDWREQCALLAFLSDFGIAPTLRDLSPDVFWKQTVSLDHSIHFFKPLEVDVRKRMFVFIESKYSFSARGLGKMHIFSEKKELLAVCSQEVLMRAHL